MKSILCQSKSELGQQAATRGAQAIRAVLPSRGQSAIIVTTGTSQQAISMSMPQIMSAQTVICSVPDERKARTVKNCLQGAVSNLAPASILQTHEGAEIYLDPAAAALLD